MNDRRIKQIGFTVDTVNEKLPIYCEARKGLAKAIASGEGNCFDRMEMVAAILSLIGYRGLVLSCISRDPWHGALFLPLDNLLLDSDSKNSSFAAEPIDLETSSQESTVSALLGGPVVFNDWMFKTVRLRVPQIDEALRDAIFS